MKKQVKRIPSLQTDREVAAYWDAHSLAEYIEDTRKGAICFIRRPERAISTHLDPRILPEWKP